MLQRCDRQLPKDVPILMTKGADGMNNGGALLGTRGASLLGFAITTDALGTTRTDLARLVGVKELR